MEAFQTPNSSSPFMTNVYSPKSSGPTGGMIFGGDGLSTHTNRAVAWLVAAIVVLVVIVVIHMVTSRLFKYNVEIPFLGIGFENKTAAIASLIGASVVGFSVGGAVYEYWSGCKSA